ncbi:DUF4267 domain-containing protein [Microvirga subterranea]|uniref:Uncharacterized protein DUF4267 n=1 Tax=Microvirga subterranea TaxID=186651 RepID=A0A370HVP5_9HYPH|nr:DUF4267 domain-containing protein [Microvirga subterranea]RDI62568.1 uncharacterized protein DUF4267 [Microvirga subterranea]
MDVSEPRTWLVLALSGVFVLLGILFVFLPRAGAALFGIRPSEDAELSYVSAIGLRDLALGFYLFALSRLSTARAVGAILAITVLIPVGDVIIVGMERGFDSPGHLLLHAGSACIMAAGAAWLLTSSKHTDRED